MFRASSLPGKPGRFRASDYLCSSEHTCIGCIAQIPMFRASNYLCSSEHMYWLHSPYPQVPSCTIFFLAWNTASMLCSEHCFFACFYARNTASLPASVLGTLLLCRLICSEHCVILCSARNIASLSASMLPTLLLCSEHCFLAWSLCSMPAFMLCSEPCFFAGSKLQIIPYLEHIFIGCIPQIPIFLETRHVPSLWLSAMWHKKTFQSRKCTIIKKVQWRHQCNISFLVFL